MTEHMCGGEWRSGSIADCETCRPHIQIPGYIKDRKATKTVMKDARGSTQTYHWSGRVDAHIKPATVRTTAKPKEGI